MMNKELLEMVSALELDAIEKVLKEEAKIVVTDVSIYYMSEVDYYNTFKSVGVNRE